MSQKLQICIQVIKNYKGVIITPLSFVHYFNVITKPVVLLLLIR